MKGTARVCAALALAILVFPHRLRAQGSAPADSSLDNTIQAGEASAEPPRRSLVKWNEYDGPFLTARLGAGFLYDFATYSQDAESEQQVDLASAAKVRDARLLLNGRIKSQRAITWSLGLMYDGAADRWLFRQTGIMVAVPEWWGHVFIGRSKEGFSLNKVMVGYAGWSMERSPISDATIPLLADGIKWLGYLPSHKLLWNFGYYVDWLSEGQSFSSYDQQVVLRLATLPLLSKADRTVLHIAFNGRYGLPDGGFLRLRSRPESNTAPYFVDTDKFPADHATFAGWEVYYRKGSWLLGHEFWTQWIASTQKGDPVVHGGDVMVSWLITGETRGYNTIGGYFNAVSPDRTVFEGGPGAWEAVLKFSSIDLDDRGLQGGKFWRLTPMVNWLMSDQVRLELAYGYGVLSRFGLEGKTQFFQGRMQLQI